MNSFIDEWSRLSISQSYIMISFYDHHFIFITVSYQFVIEQNQNSKTEKAREILLSVFLSIDSSEILSNISFRDSL